MPPTSNYVTDPPIAVLGIDAAWTAAFETVCQRGTEALQWGLPEPWIHAELFAELKHRAPTTGFHPIAHEIPYVTHCPVVLPKRRDLVTRGAVKWVDLCLHSEDRTNWASFEFKVSHTGKTERKDNADRSAMDGVRKDISALAGFDLKLTAAAWRDPDAATKSHWMADILGPHVGSLASGTQHFVMAYLELDGSLDTAFWNRTSIEKEVRNWLPRRSKAVEIPDMSITIANGIAGRHSLILAQWISKRSTQQRD